MGRKSTALQLFYTILFFKSTGRYKPGMKSHALKPRTWEEEAGSLQFQKPELHNEMLSGKKNTENWRYSNDVLGPEFIPSVPQPGTEVSVYIQIRRSSANLEAWTLLEKDREVAAEGDWVVPVSTPRHHFYCTMVTSCRVLLQTQHCLVMKLNTVWTDFTLASALRIPVRNTSVKPT